MHTLANLNSWRSEKDPTNGTGWNQPEPMTFIDVSRKQICRFCRCSVPILQECWAFWKIPESKPSNLTNLVNKLNDWRPYTCQSKFQCQWHPWSDRPNQWRVAFHVDLPGISELKAMWKEAPGFNHLLIWQYQTTVDGWNPASVDRA